MTQAEKLEALVQAGFDRAWEFDNLDKWQFRAIRKTDTVRTDWWQVIFSHGDRIAVIDAERILFDTLFARALFGEKRKSPREQGFGSYLEYDYHRMKAVISPNPISYMYKEVFDDITDGIPEGNDIV